MASPPSLDRYSIEGLLGIGGFAVVWAAIDLETRRPLALKVARAPGAAAQARFEAEAAALARVRPPWTPALLAHGVVDGRPYLALERLRGTSLAHRLERAPAALPLDTTAAIADRLLACLAAVHRAGLIHGDVAPDNVFTSDEDGVRILDLGLARAPGRARDDRAGSPEYMAPEQRLGERVDRRADVYAFGAVLYELLTLRVPFGGDAIAIERGHVSLRPHPPGELVPLPPALDELVLACLAKQPDRRPVDAETLRAPLAAAFRGPAPAATTALGRVPTRPAAPVRIEPALLLHAAVRAPAVAVAELVAAHRGVLVDCAGDRVLVALPATAGADPRGDGLALARRLVDELGARVALHLTEISIRDRPHGPPILGGADLDRPARWLPESPWTEIVATAAAARALGFAAESAGPIAIDRDPPVAPEPPFVGRRAALEAAARSLRAGAGTRTPTLVTIVAEPGAGKSRLARELANRLGNALGGTPVRLVRGGDLAIATALDDVTDASPLAVIVDDADRAPDALLDAIEYATMEGARRPTWVAVCARPGLDERRPGWGDRAGRHLRIALPGLDERDAVKVAAWAIRDVEYVARDALAKLATWADGNPRALLELVSALEPAGMIRRDGDRVRLDAAALDALPRSPLATWLAAQALAQLPPPLADLLRLVAALDEHIERDEVDAIQSALERSGRGSTTERVDAGIGLWQLRGAGLLERDGDGHRFASAVHRAGVVALLDPQERAAIHAAALAYWRARRPTDATGLAALTRHAAACGEPLLAAEAHLRLGELALASHRPVDADRELGRAFVLAGEARPRLAAAALLGRGRARYRSDRIDEALADLIAARRIAEHLADPCLAAEALLDEAIARDWADDYDGAATAAADAALRCAGTDSPRLLARLTLARGRAAWRAERVEAAIADLEIAAARATVAGDGETGVIALLLLAPALVRAGRLDEAEARFAEVIAICERDGDRLHLCAAHNNRMFLWSARRRVDLARADLASARRLARELGYPMPERRATYNLAEDLYWSGDELDRALALARRSRALQLRYITTPAAVDALLLARVLLDRGEHREPTALMAWIGTHVPIAQRSPSVRLLSRMVALAIADAPVRAWARLWTDAVRALPGDEALEVAHAWARSALAAGRPVEARAALARARALLPSFPIWQRRFDRMAETLGASPRAQAAGHHSSQNGPGVSGTSNPT